MSQAHIPLSGALYNNLSFLLLLNYGSLLIMPNAMNVAYNINPGGAYRVEYSKQPFSVRAA